VAGSVETAGFQARGNALVWLIAFFAVFPASIPLLLYYL
jgi:hypothetical protein